MFHKKTILLEFYKTIYMMRYLATKMKTFKMVMYNKMKRMKY